MNLKKYSDDIFINEKKFACLWCYEIKDLLAGDNNIKQSKCGPLQF